MRLLTIFCVLTSLTLYAQGVKNDSSKVIQVPELIQKDLQDIQRQSAILDNQMRLIFDTILKMSIPDYTPEKYEVSFSLTSITVKRRKEQKPPKP